MERVSLEASRSHGVAGFQNCGDAPPSERLEATVLLRRRSGGASRIEGIMRGAAPALSREQAAEELGADPEDLRQAANFVASYGLTILESSAAKRSLRVSGTVAEMEAAFGVKLQTCEIGGKPCLTYEGAVTIPAELDQVIVGVLGLDQRPIARR